MELHPLLGPDDAPPFRVLNPDAEAPILLVCDHASNAVPAHLGALGLEPSVFDDHTAYDIGAADVTAKLAERMGCPAVLCGYSRLLIDPNRPPGHPQSVPRESDGIAISANQDLVEDDLQKRCDVLFWPYHNAIADMIAKLWRSGAPPALVSIHSFTPGMRTCVKPRPWHIGVMYNHDERIARPMIDHLRTVPGLVVGDNEPYSGKDIGFTVDTHAGAAGLPHVSFEIRQDQVADAAGTDRWAGLLFDALAFVLVDSELHKAEVV